MTGNTKVLAYFLYLVDSMVRGREVFYRVRVNLLTSHLTLFHLIDGHVEEVGLVYRRVVVLGPGFELISHLR